MISLRNRIVGRQAPMGKSKLNHSIEIKKKKVMTHFGVPTQKERNLIENTQVNVQYYDL